MEDVKKQIHELRGNADSVENIIQLGDLYLKTQDILEARHYYERAIKEYPQSIQGYNRMANFSFCHEKFFDANNYYSQALRIDSQNIEALVGMGRTHLQQNGLDRAEFHLNKALKQAPEDPTVLFYVGLTNLKKHNLLLAERHLTASVQSKDYQYWSYATFYLGVLNFQKGFFQEALNYFNSLKAIPPFSESMPINYQALKNNIGVAHFRLGNYEYAKRAFLEVLTEKHPKNAQMWLNLAMVYWVQDKLEEALAALKTVHRLEPSKWPWLSAVTHYTTEGSEWLKAKMDSFIKENPKGVNVAMYLGCVIPNRYPFIDAATRHVLNSLKVGVVELEGAGCCPAPGVFRSFDINTWLTLGARNLTISEDLGRNMCIMCNGCYGTLNDVNTELKHDKLKRNYVNDKLKEIGKEFKGTIEAEHLVWVLYHDIGIENIKKMMNHKLDLKVAVHYGCHILKPIHNKPWKEDFETPTFLDELVEITGCTSVDYQDKLMCCGAGGGLRGSEKEISLDFTRDKLESMRKAGVDIIINCCPFCHLQFDLGQMEINNLFKDKISGPFTIPVIYISQLLGLAMGIDPFSLGLLRYPQKKGVPPFIPVDPLFTSIQKDLECLRELI